MATGVPVGLGSFMQYDRRLDADIAFHLMSINAVKGVEIGNGFASAEQYGSQVHDEITIDGKSFSRKTNHSGGIEGGISNGLPIIIRAAMKPISTLAKPLNSIDLSSMKKLSQDMNEAISLLFRLVQLLRKVCLPGLLLNTS
ncbi:MAG: chorismate synthase [Ignavibacteriales bacterium]|nr:chorismate synthase [Ignavibacteriales bacterium]